MPVIAETPGRRGAERPPPLPREAALLLDFDGTLVELAARPELVRVPPALPALLEELHRRLGGAIAIVSGRPIAQIDQFLAPTRLPVAGLHGAELRTDAVSAWVVEPPASVATLVRQLRQHFTNDPRILVEDKGVGVALHYRQAPERAEECLRLMQEQVQDPGLELLPGDMVIEARPRATDKGRALQALVAAAAFRDRVPVFVGDDRTDEDGMRAAHAAGGYGVKVGPGATVARYRCADVGEVYQWLQSSCRRLGNGT